MSIILPNILVIFKYVKDKVFGKFKDVKSE